MPGKKKSGKKSFLKNPANTSRERNMPEKSSNETRYEGYDEKRTSFNPAYQSDYDMDENDRHQRSDEYKDWRK